MNKEMNILIVDDFSTMRRIVKNLLHDLGFSNTSEADDGQTALPMLKTGKFDFLVTDWNMPGMQGIETARHLNAMDPPPAVVFITAYDEYAVDAFDARAIGYVLKPVRRSRLARALEQASRLAPAALGEVAAVFAADRQPCRQPQQVALQQALLAVGGQALVAEDGQGPEHENKTGLLLIVANHDENRLLRFGRLSFGQLFGLLEHESIGGGANGGHVDGMHDDNNHDQSENLIDELERNG